MYSLFFNQSLCTGIKPEAHISFKSAESVADSHQFKTIHQFYNKKLFQCYAVLTVFVFFLWDFSRVKKIKNNQTSLCQPSNPFHQTYIKLIPHIIFNLLQHSCPLENGKKSCDCITDIILPTA